MEKLRLFPNRYKKFAVLGLFSFTALALIIKISGFQLDSYSKEILKNLVQSGVLISLLCLALTASKQEDELTIQIRIKAFTNAFIFGVGFAAIIPFSNLLVDGEIAIPSLFELLIGMFAVFFISYYSIKKKVE